MGNSLRCCLACVLPCGALDVIRIVHLSGHIEEYSRPVFAGEIAAANPGHVLSKPCSSAHGGVVAARLLIVSPESELKRGGFYFLIPSSSVPGKNRKSRGAAAHKNKTKRKVVAAAELASETKPPPLEQDVLPEKKSGLRRKRSGRVRVWKPRLESILEDS